MDPVQKLLAVVIVSLTILLFIVGIQVILIMSDLRRAIKRLNSILEDSILGGGLIRPEKLTGVLKMFRKGRTLQEEERGNMGDDLSDSEQ